MKDTIVTAIKDRSVGFTLDMIQQPSAADFRVIENAMLIGASIAIQDQQKQQQNELYSGSRFYNRLPIANMDGRGQE